MRHTLRKPKLGASPKCLNSPKCPLLLSRKVASSSGSDRETAPVAAAPMSLQPSGCSSILACSDALRTGTVRGPLSLTPPCLLHLWPEQKAVALAYERLLQICQHVFERFDAHRQADQAV